ncbi:MAG: hypothetical protein AB1730_21940 [Myxococcota bacterium]
MRLTINLDEDLDRQVTDAYLAQLARPHHAKVAAFDVGFSRLQPDATELLPA